MGTERDNTKFSKELISYVCEGGREGSKFIPLNVDERSPLLT